MEEPPESSQGECANSELGINPLIPADMRKLLGHDSEQILTWPAKIAAQAIKMSRTAGSRDASQPF